MTLPDICERSQFKGSVHNGKKNHVVHSGGKHDEFDFIHEERRGHPEFRTTHSVFEACALVQEEGLVHYLGVKYIICLLLHCLFASTIPP